MNWAAPKALRRRLGVPRSRGVVVLRDTRAVIHENTEVELGAGVALHRRLGVPSSRGLEVLRDANAVLEEDTEGELGVSLALRRSFGVPLGRCHGVLRDAFAIIVTHAKLELRNRMPAISCLAPRTHNLGRRCAVML